MPMANVAPLTAAVTREARSAGESDSGRRGADRSLRLRREALRGRLPVPGYTPRQGHGPALRAGSLEPDRQSGHHPVQRAERRARRRELVHTGGATQRSGTGGVDRAYRDPRHASSRRVFTDRARPGTVRRPHGLSPARRQARLVRPGIFFAQRASILRSRYDVTNLTKGDPMRAHLSLSVVLILVGAWLAPATASGQEAHPRGGTLLVAIPADPGHLNPAITT